MAISTSPSTLSSSRAEPQVAEQARSRAAVRPPGSVAVRGRPRATAQPAPTERLRAEQCILDWLANPTKPDKAQPEGDAAATPLTTLLGRVCTSSRELPTEAAAMLGMPDGVTIGAAAAELVLAVNDPAGPRCRSYRAAVYYLHDLHGLSAVFEDLTFEDL